MEFEKKNLGKILMGEGDWFGALLLRTIARADTPNRAKLYSVYPDHVNAVHEYQTGQGFGLDHEYNEVVINGCKDDETEEIIRPV